MNLKVIILNIEADEDELIQKELFLAAENVNGDEML